MILTVTAREAFYKRLHNLEWEESHMEGGTWALASTSSKEDPDLATEGIDLAVLKTAPYSWTALSYERDQAFGFDNAGLRGEAASFEEAKQKAIDAAYSVAVAHIQELWTGTPFTTTIKTVKVPAIKDWASANAERLYHIMATLSDLGIEEEDVAFQYARILHHFVKGPIETVEDATRNLYTACTQLGAIGVPMQDLPEALQSSISLLTPKDAEDSSDLLYAELSKKDTTFFEEMID